MKTFDVCNVTMRRLNLLLPSRVVVYDVSVYY